MSAAARAVASFSWDEVKHAEPRLAALEHMARLFAHWGAAAPDFCANDVWYRGIKPFLVTILGDGRAFAEEDAKMPSRELAPEVSFSDLFAPIPMRPAPTTEMERFLRTREAYEFAQEHLYDLLPGCGRCACL